MTDEFINQQLTTSVAQICSNIGWHSMSNSTLQMMTDILYGYFKDLAQSVKKFSEISDKLNPDIDDVKIAFQEKDVAIPDIINYLKQVGSIKSLYQVPKFPIPTKSNLNIMKPGNTEIIRRPISIHEHLPTMFSEQIEENVNQTPINYSLGINNKTLPQTEIFKEEKPTKENVILHKRLREISSVVMTSSGFISSSRHGRLPDSRLTLSNLQFAQKPSHPTVLPEVKSGHQLKKNFNLLKEKKIIEPTTNYVKKDEKICVKKTLKLKELKTGNDSKSNQKIKKSSNNTDISKMFLLNTIFDKPVEHLKIPKSSSADCVKLTTEPDKQKLNIFKKISKVKEDSLTYQSSKLNNLNLPKPSSTIVSKDITIKPDSKSDIIVDKSSKPVALKQITEKKTLKNVKIDQELTASKKRKVKIEIQNNDYNNLKTEPINSIDNLVIKKHKNKHEHDLNESSVKFSFFGQDIQKTPHFLASNPLIPKCTISSSGFPILESNFFNELPPTLTTEDKKLSKKLKPKKLKKVKKDKIKTKNKKNKKNRNERKKDKLLKKIKIEEKLDSEKLVLPEVVLEEKKKENVPKTDEAVSILKVKLPDSNKSNCSSLKRKIVIKPMVKNKSPPICANDSSKEKSPIKSLNTKSRILKKEKEIVNLSESKVPKLKKSTIIDSQPMNIDKPSLDNISVSSVTSDKNKVKSPKKCKKNITQNLSAFYYDEFGNQVWICPTCGKQDDGSPMIGCDYCDAWYHWVCMGIQCPPDCAVWYCPICLSKRAQRNNNHNEKSVKRGRPVKKSVT